MYIFFASAYSNTFSAEPGLNSDYCTGMERSFFYTKSIICPRMCEECCCTQLSACLAHFLQELAIFSSTPSQLCKKLPSGASFPPLPRLSRHHFLPRQNFFFKNQKVASRKKLAYSWKDKEVFCRLLYIAWGERVMAFPTRHSERCRNSRPPHHQVAQHSWAWHCKEDPIYVFPEMKLRGLVPSFHIHVNDLYIPMRAPPILLQQNRQTSCGNI